jgi:FkbM family methyltransferase
MALAKALKLAAYRLLKLHRILGVRGAFLFGKQWLQGKELIVFRLRNNPYPVYCRRSTSDIHVLWQVFGAQQYNLSLPMAPSTIVDAGANIGYASLYFALIYPEARILAIEPESANCEMFVRNCGEYPQISLMQAALWPRRARVRVQSTEAESWAFQIVELEDGQSGSAVAVATITMTEVLGRVSDDRVDLLKLDIEGTERQLFESEPERWLQDIGSLCVECHDLLFPGTSEKVISVMSNSNFKLVLRTDELLHFRRR